MTQPEAIKEPIRQTLSTDDWKRIEEKLSSAYGLVNLLIDGFTVTLQVQKTKPRRYEIVVFVNGWFRAEWLLKDCDQRRRFYDRKTKYVFSKKIREAERKFNKRYPNIGTSNPDLTYEYWVPWWASFSRMKAHFLKNNQSIEWVNNG